jgi:hypothetical protein
LTNGRKEPINNACPLNFISDY